MKSSPRKSVDTCNTLLFEPDSPLIDLSENYYEKYIDLKQKYTKLYKDYNLLLKICEFKTSEEKDLIKLTAANQKIRQQQEEILKLRERVDELNSKVDKEKGKRRRMSLSMEMEREKEENVGGLDVSADICLINLLIHRMILGFGVRKEELVKYKMALCRIEEKIGEMDREKRIFN